MTIKARLQKLEKMTDSGYSVRWPTAYRSDDTPITECNRGGEVAYLVYSATPPLRVDRDEGEDRSAFDVRALEQARSVLKSALIMRWDIILL
jgi:hypothetical protein